MRIRHCLTPLVCSSMVLLFSLAGGDQLAAQSEDGHAGAGERVARILLGTTPEHTFPPDGGAWGLVVGRFAKGDEKALEFDAEVGEMYVVSGIGLADADVDIRLFDPQGVLVDEDLLEDSYPVVSFIADSRGTYRAVMSAAAVQGGSSYAGMVVLQPPRTDANEGDQTQLPSQLTVGARVHRGGQTCGGA